MKPKHLQIRIEQCQALAKASNCPRRKFGALLLDPIRNVILVDGYNGGPRGGGDLCASLDSVSFCARDGIQPEDLTVAPHGENDKCYVMFQRIWISHRDGRALYGRQDAEAYREELLRAYPPITSGTHMEVGCHHSETNVVCNAAAAGIATTGAWLIVTGEPCLMCAKIIHHAGIAKVILIKGGYMGLNGVNYLRQHGVDIEEMDGPQDPRTAA